LLPRPPISNPLHRIAITGRSVNPRLSNAMHVSRNDRESALSS
jgi:hypothetical protein